MTSWLVRSSPDRAVQVRVPPGTLHCVLGQDTLLSNCLSPPKCTNGYRRTSYDGLVSSFKFQVY